MKFFLVTKIIDKCEQINFDYLKTRNIRRKRTSKKTFLSKLSRTLDIAHRNKIDAICAYELGRLDAVHDNGYLLAPHKKDEMSYFEGYRSVETYVKTETIIPGTYFEKSNWGWY